MTGTVDDFSVLNVECNLLNYVLNKCVYEDWSNHQEESVSDVIFIMHTHK